MLKILKYLKKSTVALVFVTILLILQAYCDLSLPTYTSEIINIGIMRGGIPNAVPDIIRASEMQKILLFSDEAGKETIQNHYTLLDKNTMEEKQLNSYLNKYPLLASENLYLWDKKEQTALENILPFPMMLLYGMEHPQASSGSSGFSMKSLLPADMADSNVDLSSFSSMPPEQVAVIVGKMRESVGQIPATYLQGAAATYIKSEYEAIGVNVSRMQTNYILLVGAKMLGLALLAMIASVSVTLFAARIAAKMGRELRNRVFRKVLSFSNKEMDQFSTASLITRSTNDIQQVQMLTVMMIRIVIYAPILAMGGIFKIVDKNTSMTWTLGVGVGAVFILISTLLVITMPKFKKMQKLVDRINLVMRETLTGLPVIRAFSTEKHEKQRFDEANLDLTRNNLFVNRVMTLMMPALMLIMNLVSILIIWVGAGKINDGTMQVGDMMAFIQYTMQIIISFLMLTMISVVLPRAGVAAKRIDEVLTVNEDIKDPQTEELSDIAKKGVLEFKGVNFRYPNAEEDVLSDINFVAKPGETTAIIGSTGSGKTSLINLIPRFYDVSSGSVEIDGLNIKRYKLHTLRNKLGFVPQKGVLFSGTIQSNIAFGKPDSLKEAVSKAARIAQAEEFIEAKPEGYEAPIAQGGTNVSGGQKQRLSIARAIAKNPEIYIFDDSFSALDYKTDSSLRKALKEELSESTVIIVAQRISTIMHAEQILVLDEGRIVGKGTHKELLKDCEVYRQIASSQLSKEELNYE
jgi:ATP-binding cassette subfamily B protein